MVLDKAFIGSVIAMVLAILIIYGICKWEIYKFEDCRAVGHAVLYCLFARG
jgi:hypothetical protein